MFSDIKFEAEDQNINWFKISKAAFDIIFIKQKEEIVIGVNPETGETTNSIGFHSFGELNMFADYDDSGNPVHIQRIYLQDSNGDLWWSWRSFVTSEMEMVPHLFFEYFYRMKDFADEGALNGCGLVGAEDLENDNEQN